MKKILFLDRDGTLILEPEDEQIDSYEKLRFLPGVFYWLGRIVRELDYDLVMITNQDGLGTKSFPEHTFWPAHNLMMQTFTDEGIHFSEVLIDRTFPYEEAETRKPGTGLMKHYMMGHYDLENSFVVGDRASDIKLADNLGAKGIFIAGDAESEGSTGDSGETSENPEGAENAAITVKTWEEIYQFLSGLPRRVTEERVTKETRIQVTVDLEGAGNANIATGLGFFDHMLEQIARHGGIDLDISVEGDLQIDEHHTIEDTALVLGAAFKKALGSRKGIQRYGFFLPMDDARAQVGIDFGGRPWLVWEAEFKREMVGDMPTEMFRHFFKSFSDTAACNLAIKVEGENEHHKIEAIFKAFARAIRMAIAKTGDGILPSTKGTLS